MNPEHIKPLILVLTIYIAPIAILISVVGMPLLL